MGHSGKLVLAAAMALCIGTGSAKAETITSYYLVQGTPYTSTLPMEEKMEIRKFLAYEQREPCQHYQQPPAGFVQMGCYLYEVKTTYIDRTPKTPKMNIGNVISDYEMHFALDSAAIEPAAGATLDKIAHDIKRFKPREVVVGGYTDTSGPAAYNMALSQKRAQAVSQALTARGVQHRILDIEAHGQNDLAVKTADGVRLKENRRVTVEFRK